MNTSMEKWHRRLMRLMLPFGIVWLAYGVLELIVVLGPSEPRPAAAFQGIMAIIGGLIFMLNWWVSRREVR